jgi:hypothetical protein
MLRLFLAWRLVRMLRPLLLCGLLALLVTAAMGVGSPSARRGQSSLARAGAGIERVVWPLVLNARHALTRALTGTGR